MAKFKLRFIVPNNDSIFTDKIENYEEYIATTITDFEDQRSRFKSTKENIKQIGIVDSSNSLIASTVAYTYNEKLSLHKNAQKELTFSMDDKLYINQEWIENPYARILRVGCQLELTDKFNNIMLFTIQKIQYTLKNLNIVYNITCQDSFTYQLNRQNSGYNLENNETSSDFIGALDIDEWAYKVTKDCYITYTYVPLDTGIYQYKKENSDIVYTATFSVAGDDVLLSPKINLGDKVQKIIKPIFNKANYREYYETFPFSASNSSANAALISMAETLGLQLHVIEGYSESTTEGKIIYKRFFYFGPIKNNDASGLSYSPKKDVQNLGLSFNGDSLTTVLNVNSTTWEDEEIGLFPAMPGIFQSIILNNQWTDTVYYPGFFTEIVKGNSFSDKNILSLSGEKQGNDEVYYEAFVFNNTLKWPLYYDRMSLIWDDKYYTTIQLTKDGSTIFYTPFNSKSLLRIGFTFENDEKLYVYNLEESIPEKVINTYNQCYLLVKKDYEGEAISPIIVDFYMRLTREWVQDEIDFAEIAEECPWLENKLINFSYFVQQGILSRAEFEGLMRWLQNDLRIINGQLMCYASSYLHGLHERVKYLSEIETSLDTLGAEFYNTFLSPYETTGQLGRSVSNFTGMYNNLFKLSNTPENKTALINLNQAVSTALNKYINAEQRFLKNIYNFRQYFNSPNIYTRTFGTDILDDACYAMSWNGDNTNKIFSFSDNITYQSVDANCPILAGVEKTSSNPYSKAFFVNNVYSKVGKNYVKRKIPYEWNYATEFYIPLIKAGDFLTVESGHQYNSNNKYYLSLTDYCNFMNKKETDPSVIAKTIVINNVSYIELNIQEIKLYYAQWYNTTHNTNAFYFREKRKVPLDWVRCNLATIKNAITADIWPGLNILKQWNPGLAANPGDWNKIKGAILTKAWALYKLLIPIDKVYIKDYKISYGKKSTFISPYGTKVTPYGWFYYKEDNTPTEDLSEAAQTFYEVPFLTYRDSITSAVTNVYNDSYITLNNLGTLLDNLNNNNTKYYTASKNQEAVASAMTSTFFTTLGWTMVAILAPWHIQKSINAIKESTGSTLSTVLSQGREWTQNNTTDFSLAQWLPTYNFQTWENATPSLGEPNHTLQPYEGKDGACYGDSHWVNYVTTSSAESEIRTLTNAWIKDHPDDTNKHYFNYYKYIVATYSQGTPYTHSDSDLTDTYSSPWIPESAYNKDWYYIENEYAVICSNQSLIDFTSEYIWVPASTTDVSKDKCKRLFTGSDYITSDTKIPDFTNNKWQRFSTIKFYPVVSEAEIINFSEIFDNDNEDYTLENYITKINELNQNSEEDTYIQWTYEGPNTQDEKYLLCGTYTIGDKNYYTFYYIMKKEPYERILLANEASDYLQSPFTFQEKYSKCTKNIYWGLTTTNQTLLKEKDIIFNHNDGNNFALKYIPSKDAQLIRPIDIDGITEEQLNEYWTNDTTHWYEENNLDSRIYTVKQYFDASANNLYYLGGNDYKTSEFISEGVPYKIPLTIKWCSYIINENNNVILNEEVNNKLITLDSTDFDNDTSSTVVQIDNIVITIKRTNTSYKLNKMSNGEFWYFFRDRLDITDILQKAAVIETELENYWKQAYTASQYCKWFIPEHWQDNPTDTKTNFFAPFIYRVMPEDDNIRVKIIDQLIPQVEIEKYNNQYIIPYYQFFVDEVKNTEEWSKVKERHTIDTIGVLNSNSTIIDTLKQFFGEDYLYRVTAQEYGTTTYYNRIGGGWLRKDVAYKLDATQKVYDSLTGLYGMQISLLLKNFINAPVTQYEKTLANKLRIWKMLYARYPGIFLESTYQNNDVRSSKQLLKMAKLAFKDYTAPEKQYNITMIDAAALEGYKGQELRLGDGILIRTSDYYDAIDETYRALNQYLFISDISYELRKDTDIALTVNTIKYQDKLLQSIVKLIR